MVVGRKERMADSTLGRLGVGRQERIASSTLERLGVGRQEKLADRTLERLEKEGLERVGRSSSLPPTSLDRLGLEGASSRARKVGASKSCQRCLHLELYCLLSLA